MLSNFIRHQIKGHEVKDPVTMKIFEEVHLHIIPYLNLPSIEEAATIYQNYSCEEVPNGLASTSPYALDLLHKLKEEHKFDVILTVESGGLFMMMPWQKLHNGVAATEDEEVFQSLAHAFADNYPEIYQPDACKTSPNHGIFHGAELHSQTYSLMDDMYINGHSYMLAAFVSCCRYPHPEQLPELWMKTMQPIKQLVLRSKQGVAGQVLDSVGSVVRNASITIDSNTGIFSSSEDGHFYIPLTQGPHTIHIKAEGFEPQSHQAVIQKDSTSQISAHLNAELKEMGYHTLATMEEFLRNVSKQCQALVNLHSLGKSSNNKDIWMLDFGNQNEKIHRSSLNHMLLVAGIHGNEAVGPELLLQISNELCESYGKDSILTKMLNVSVVHIIPVVNPEGAAVTSPASCNSTIGKYNAKKVDLLSNFHTAEDKVGQVQPETQLLMDWMMRTQPVLTLMLRSGYQGVTTPSYVNLTKPEMSVLDHVGRKFTGILAKLEKPGINCKENSDLFNNTFLEYAYSHCHSIPLEISTGCCHHPSEDQMLDIWHKLREPLLDMITEGNKGFSGIVVEKDTHTKMVNATLRIQGFSWTYFVNEEARFHVYLPPGSYQVVVTCHGYQNYKMNIVVPNTEEGRIETVIELQQPNTVLGLSQSTFIIVTSMVVLGLILLCTIAICIKARASRKMAGFSRLNLEDEDDEYDEYYDNGSTKKFLNREYHDESTDEEDVFEKKLLKR